MVCFFLLLLSVYISSALITVPLITRGFTERLIPIIRTSPLESVEATQERIVYSQIDKPYACR